MYSLAAPQKPALKERKRAAPSGAGTPTPLKKAKPAVKAVAQDVSRSFYLELGPADIKPKSESWRLHGCFEFQFNPKISDDYTTTVFQKKALETYKEKIGDGSIYKNANKILDGWKGVEIRIDPSLCTLDCYGYLKCYTTVVGADGDSVTEKKKEELNLCCRAFVMSLIETVFGCVWYHVMDNVVRQINLNPVIMKTVYFDVPTEFEEYKKQICEQWERKVWANPEEKEALLKHGPVGFVRQSVKAATPAAPAKAADKGPAAPACPFDYKKHSYLHQFTGEPVSERQEAQFRVGFQHFNHIRKKMGQNEKDICKDFINLYREWELLKGGKGFRPLKIGHYWEKGFAPRGGLIQLGWDKEQFEAEFDRMKKAMEEERRWQLQQIEAIYSHRAPTPRKRFDKFCNPDLGKGLWSYASRFVPAASPATPAAPAKATTESPTPALDRRDSLEQRAFLERESLVKAVIKPAAVPAAKAVAKFKKLVEGKEGKCTACGDVEKIHFDDGTDKLCKPCTFDHQVEDVKNCPYKVFQCQAYCKKNFVILKDNTCPDCHDKGPFWKEDWVNDGAGDWVPPQWDLDTPFEQYKAMGYKKGSCVCGWEGHKCELNSPYDCNECEGKCKCHGKCTSTGICDYDYIRKNWDEPGKDWCKRPICEDCLNSCSRC